MTYKKEYIMQNKFSTTAIAATTVALLLLGACGSGEVQVGGAVTTPTEPTTTTVAGSTPTTTVSNNGTNEDMWPVSVYFLADDAQSKSRTGPFLIPAERQIPFGPNQLADAVTALLAGPSASESAASISTSVPSNSTVLGATITGLTSAESGQALGDGVAEINLSSGFESGGGTLSITSRLAQLVFTATDFDGVSSVRLLIDGDPVDVFSSEGLVIDGPLTRDDFADLVPNIMLELPATSAVVEGPIWLHGTAAVFEAVFQARLEANGEVLWEGQVTTTNGTGWGDFDMGIPAQVSTETDATLTVWEYSAEDGSVINERTHQLTLKPWEAVTDKGCPTIPSLVAIGSGALAFGQAQQVEDLTGGVEVTISPANYLIGANAVAAAAANGEQPVDGIYFQASGPQVGPFLIAENAPICLITADGTGAFIEDRGYADTDHVTPTEYAAIYADTNSADWYSNGRIIWYTLDGNTITSIAEQYLP